MRTIAEAVQPDMRGNVARFAARVGVSWPTAWRWCLPPEHPEAVVPPPKWWTRIEQATEGRWTAPRQFALADAVPPKIRPGRRRRPSEIDAAAARKGAATRRRQRSRDRGQAATDRDGLQ